MTEFSSALRGNRFVYKISGHAGFASYGSDVVCAALSTLTYLVYHAAKRLEEEGLLTSFRHAVKPGLARIEFTVKDDGLSRAKFVFDAVDSLVGELSAQYPKNVKKI